MWPLRKLSLSSKLSLLRKLRALYEKNCPIIKNYNDKNKNFMLIQLSTKLLYGLTETSYHWATYYPHYKEKLEMTKFTYNTIFFWPLLKLLSLFDDWFNNIIKFDTYDLYYNDKIAVNLIRTFGFYFLYNFKTFLIISSILAGNNRAYNTELGLVTKKKKLPKTFLYLFLNTLNSNCHW